MRLSFIWRGYWNELNGIARCAIGMLSFGWENQEKIPIVPFPKRGVGVFHEKQFFPGFSKELREPVRSYKIQYELAF
jgi:hypothetical protein